MPIDPVKIPQNVYIEDRVVGPLSLRQIIIMTLSGGFSYTLFTALTRVYGNDVSIVFKVAMWIPAVIGAAFALVKINDLSLMRILFLLIERVYKPSERVLAPRQGISIVIRYSNVPKEEKQKVQTSATHEQIREISSVVDRASITTPADDTLPADEEPIPTPIAESPSITQENEEPAAPRTYAPVNPAAIGVDGIPPPVASTLSDLSIFRDVLPPDHPWH